MEYLYNWKFVGVLLGAGLLIYLLNLILHLRARKRHGHLLTEDSYSSPEVLAHSGQRRVFALDPSHPLYGKAPQREHPVFGPLVLQVRGKITKHIALALFIWAVAGTALYVFSARGPEIAEPPFGDWRILWAVLAAVSLYGLYRVTLCFWRIELYRDGLVERRFPRRREIAYDRIAQMAEQDYLRRRYARSDQGYRRAWACHLVLKDGTTAEFQDSRYYRLRHRMRCWMEHLSWVD